MPQGLLGTSAATRPSPIVKLWLNSSGYYFFPPHCFCGCWDKSGKRTLQFCFSIANFGVQLISSPEQKFNSNPANWTCAF